jgi:hypothetical protein
MALPSALGFHRRVTAGGVAYTVGKGVAGSFFKLVLFVFALLLAGMLGFSIWTLVWLWLGGEHATDPRTATVAYWVGLAAGVAGALPILLLFRKLWRRFGGGFELSRLGIIKDGRLVPWTDVTDLRLIDSTEGLKHPPETTTGMAMNVVRANGMALAFDAAGQRVLLAVGLDLPRAQLLYGAVAGDMARLRK